jgi:ribonucleoside-diphosphate reductase alpha chain
MQKGKKFLSDLKLHSDYLKWIDGEERYETWNDACESIIDGHRKKYKGLKIGKYLDEALGGIKEKLVLASQRNLQYRYPQVMKHNARMYNCVGSLFNKNEWFQKYFYVLLCGCGLDFSVRRKFIAELSSVQKRSLGTKTFVIPDSIEGWADAAGVLMSSYFVDNQPFPEYAGYEIKFDFSLIREKGAFISGGFRAPGPEGLKQSLERIEKLIEAWLIKESGKIRGILAYDIIMHLADAVLSGGVRRSACSVIMDEGDEEMIGAKLGNWRQENPQRARSNNAIGLLRKEFSKERMEEIIGMNQGDNEISFILVNDEEEVSNPCREITFRPILEDGRSGLQSM